MSRSLPEQADIEARRAQVARLCRKRLSTTEIARRVGLSRRQVTRYIHKNLEEALASRVKNADLILERELSQLDVIEKEAYEAFEKSKEDDVTTRKRIGGKDGGFEETIRKGQSGNPTFLEVARKSIMDKLRIQGLDTPDLRSGVGDSPLDIQVVVVNDRSDIKPVVHVDTIEQAEKIGVQFNNDAQQLEHDENVIEGSVAE